MKLTNTALDILRLTITQSSESEVREGQEVPSALRLNGVESSQRRHFLGKVNPILDKRDEDRNKAVEDAKTAWKESNKKKAKEEDPSYEKRMIVALNADKELIASMEVFQDAENDIDLEDKTIEVIKKYYIEYGDKVGWGVSDDKVVEQINEVMGIV